MNTAKEKRRPGKKIPVWLKKRIQRRPRNGNGFHQWAGETSRKMAKEGFDGEEIEKVLRFASQGIGRTYKEHEVRADVAHGLKSKDWKPESGSLRAPEVDFNPKEAKWGIANAPPPSGDPGVEGVGPLDALECMFGGDVLVTLGKTPYDSTTRLISEWRERGVDGMTQMVPNPAWKREGIADSTGKASSRAKEIYVRTRIVVEFDGGMPLGDQAALLRWLGTGMPLLMVVWSGKKSLHGTFCCDGKTEEAVHHFFSYACAVGADPKMWSQNQYSRFPGGLNPGTGNEQKLLYLRRPPAPPSDAVEEPEVCDYREEPPCEPDEFGTDQFLMEPVCGETVNIPTAPEEDTPEVEVVTDKADLERVAKDLETAERIALDVETYGPGKNGALDAWDGDIRLLTLRGDDGKVWTLDLMTIGYCLGPLKEVLEEKIAIAHNAKFDLLFLRVNCGIVLDNVEDTLTASRILSAGLHHPHPPKGYHSLDKKGGCLERHLDIPPQEFAGGLSDWSQPELTEEQYAYASADVVPLGALSERLRTLIADAGLDTTWRLEMELLPAVVDMEFTGVYCDVEMMKKIEEEQGEKAARLKEQLIELFDLPELNPNSVPQLKAALHLKGVMVPSTGKDVLKEHEDETYVPAILEYRDAFKRASQAKTYLGFVKDDGRIHASFNPTAARTGRFSCSEPNLQQIGHGPLREAFKAPEGKKFVRVDYSQIELRVAAHIAQEENMLRAYAEGEDLHAITAGLLLGKDPSEVDGEWRRRAKAVNFGMLFGGSPDGLVRYAKSTYDIDMTVEEASKFMDIFFEAYPGLKVWQDKMRRIASDATEARTLIGRRRLIPATASRWEHFSVLNNTPIQGTAADAFKMAIVALYKNRKHGKMVSVIHDEIIDEVEEEYSEECLKDDVEILEEALAKLISVPVEADGAIVNNYGEK